MCVLDSGASTAKAEGEKEPLTRRRIPLLQRDLEKPSSTQSQCIIRS